MDIDARGPRFGAVITTIVLAVALATTSVWLLLAQTLVFAAIGVIGYATGLTGVGIAFTALALAAAFLNAAFDFCLGCQMYLFIRRIWPSQRRAAA